VGGSDTFVKSYFFFWYRELWLEFCWKQGRCSCHGLSRLWNRHPSPLLDTQGRVFLCIWVIGFGKSTNADTKPFLALSNRGSMTLLYSSVIASRVYFNQRYPTSFEWLRLVGFFCAIWQWTKATNRLQYGQVSGSIITSRLIGPSPWIIA